MTLPVLASRAYNSHRCDDESADESPPLYGPVLNVAAPRLLMALVTNSRLPQMIGLECASPGMLVRHRMFSRVPRFQRSGNCWPSAIPLA